MAVARCTLAGGAVAKVWHPSTARVTESPITVYSFLHFGGKKWNTNQSVGWGMYVWHVWYARLGRHTMKLTFMRAQIFSAFTIPTNFLVGVAMQFWNAICWDPRSTVQPIHILRHNVFDYSTLLQVLERHVARCWQCLSHPNGSWWCESLFFANPGKDGMYRSE